MDSIQEKVQETKSKTKASWLYMDKKVRNEWVGESSRRRRASILVPSMRYYLREEDSVLRSAVVPGMQAWATTAAISAMDF
jgi:hypothetical protein